MFLECYASTAYAIYKKDTKPNYLLLLKTSGTATAVYAIGCRALWEVSGYSAYCWLFRSKSFKDPVHVQHCVMVVDAIGAGAFGL